MVETLIQTNGMELLPTEALESIKNNYKEQPELVKLVEGVLAARQAETEAKAKADNFRKAIEGIAKKLPNPPANVYNFYASFREVEEINDNAPAEEVEIINAQGETVKEMRKPVVKVQKWVVVVNHSCHIQNGNNGKSAATSDVHKRAITVSQKQGDRLVNIGNFKSAKEACTHLKLAVNGDSAVRVLTNNKYYSEPYQGTDYKA